MPDNSLITEQGWHLSQGDWLSPAEARKPLEGRRVLLHIYHEPTEDITGNATRIKRLFEEFTTHGELFKHTASLYSDGKNSVLVFQWHH